MTQESADTTTRHQAVRQSIRDKQQQLPRVDHNGHPLPQQQTPDTTTPPTTA